MDRLWCWHRPRIFCSPIVWLQPGGRQVVLTRWLIKLGQVAPLPRQFQNCNNSSNSSAVSAGLGGQALEDRGQLLVTPSARRTAEGSHTGQAGGRVGRQEGRALTAQVIPCGRPWCHERLGQGFKTSLEVLKGGKVLYTGKGGKKGAEAGVERRHKASGGVCGARGG